MAITVSTFPKDANVENYTVQEDAIPLAPGDLGAGTGTINASGDNYVDDVFSFGTSTTLTDTPRGSVTGIINDVNDTESGLNIAANNVLGKFDVIRTIDPVSPVASVNYVTNPAPLSGNPWTANYRGGAGTTTYFASGSGLGANLPVRYVRMAWSSASVSGGPNIVITTAPVSAGVYSVSIYVRTNNTRDMAITVTGGTAVGTLISSPATSASSGVWTRITATYRVTTAGTISFGVITLSGPWHSGQTLDASAAMVTLGSSTTPAYFDGSTAPPGAGWSVSWNSAINGSSSTLTNDNYQTFGYVFASWCLQVGILEPPIMSDSIYFRPVVYPGWEGNVWEMLKHCLTAEQLELYVVGSQVGVREIRSTTVNIDNRDSLGENVGRSSAAKAVEITYYNNALIAQKEVYPVEGEDPQVYQVGANETLEFDIELRTHLYTVNQPVCVDWVEADDHYYDNTSGVYAVAGNDNLPFPASEWLAFGGSLSVARTANPSVIHVTITGCTRTDYAPYRIAMATLGEFYSALRITGDGVQFTPTVVSFPTGVDPAIAADDLGDTVQNPFISSFSQALNLGSRTAAAYSGTAQGITVGTGDTALDFGTVPGARILQPGANFRVNNVTYTPDAVTLVAQEDTTLNDLMGVWAPSDTLGQLQTSWSGKSLKEWSLRPLRRV